MEGPEGGRSSSAGFTCAFCAATFGRLEHLQRHTSSAHTVERPFPCTFCDQSFARRDVLVRHLKSCKARTGNSGPCIPLPSRKRGRKRKSCETCSRQKRACSGTQPCLACVHRKQPCLFPGGNILGDNGDKLKDDWVEDDEDATAVEDWDGQITEGLGVVEQIGEPSYLCHPQGALPELQQSTSQTMGAYGSQTDMQEFLDATINGPATGACSLRFLSNFTNTTGMASSFDCGTTEQRMTIMQALLADSQPGQQTANAGHPADKTHMIVCSIREAVESLQRRRATRSSWSYPLEMACSSFFSPGNLHRFLVSYWALWNPNVPNVHRPTFSIETAPAALVAVMALMGAVLSPYQGDRENALSWLDFVEEWIFSDPNFRDDTLPFDPQDVTNPELQLCLDALKTAYLCIVLQTWEGTEEAKRRARRSRYTDIIGAYRSLCSKTITHGDIRSYIGQPDPQRSWKQFAVKEALIRSLTYIVLLDSAYAIFNNTPARMVLQEARIAISCPDACFQAEDVQSWEQSMKLWQASELGRQQLTISQVVCLIWHERLMERDWAMLRQMSLLNMFIIVHPLHVQLFHVRGHPLPGNQTVFLRQAFDNWKLIHTQRTGVPGLPEPGPMVMGAQDWWKRTGFPQYAFEYWCLADFILTSCETSTLSDFDQNGHRVENFVSQLLRKYDESDMRQVHDLVELFSSMNLAV